MKTIDQLNEEMDEAIDRGDLEEMDRIAEEIQNLESGNTQTDDSPNDVPDPDSTDDAGSADGEDGDGDGSSAKVDDDDGGDDSSGDNAKGDDRLVPLKELKAARQEAAQLKQQLEDLQGSNDGDAKALNEELEKNRRLLEALQEQVKENGLEPAKLPEDMTFDLTGLMEKLKNVDEYGDIGAVVKEMGSTLADVARQNEFLKSRLLANQQSATKTDTKTETNEPQAIVDSDADLSRWQQAELSWSEVQKVDQYLQTLPQFAGKPLSERIPKLKEMVKQRLGEAPAPAPEPEKTPAATTQKTPHSLSDIGGADVGTEATFAERTADKSEAEIYEEMEKMVASGKSIDDILAAGL